MMQRTNILTFILFVIIINSCQNNEFETHNYFSRFTNALNHEDSVIVDLNKLMNFEWDSLYIIYEYNPLTSWKTKYEIEQSLNIDLSNLDNFTINERQDYSLFCFIQNKAVVKYMTVPNEFEVRDVNHCLMTNYYSGYRNHQFHSRDESLFNMKLINGMYHIALLQGEKEER